MTAPTALQPALDPAALRRARNASGLTLEEVGDAIGRHWVTIAKYERGAIDLPASVLGALAGVYRVEVGAFFTTQ